MRGASRRAGAKLVFRVVAANVVPPVIVPRERRLKLFGIGQDHLVRAFKCAAVIDLRPAFHNELLIPFLVHQNHKPWVAHFLELSVYVINDVCGIEAPAVGAAILVSESGIEIPRSFKPQLFAAARAEIHVHKKKLDQ